MSSEVFGQRVSQLVEQVAQWVDQQDGWATKRYPKRMRDRDGKVFEIFALYLQRGPTRVLLDPIASDVPGSEALVDLYLMPTYDDLASLYFQGDGWTIHYDFGQHGNVAEAEQLPLDEVTFIKVLESIVDHAVPSF